MIEWTRDSGTLDWRSIDPIPEKVTRNPSSEIFGVTVTQNSSYM